jgi:hypothetical protein
MALNFLLIKFKKIKIKKTRQSQPALLSPLWSLLQPPAEGPGGQQLKFDTPFFHSRTARTCSTTAVSCVHERGLRSELRGFLDTLHISCGGLKMHQAWMVYFSNLDNDGDILV